ncbi:MAG TPA: GWxTD domain-containing protein [Pyrinomonadaceae bacterium]|nr:GWxTD domain-containing protein [Chloracidobacterium sp.]MBP9935015.1 GWxTD domain-containing protein [Pyrinomonadaceae bacterium]MBK7801358.1 GWxTD domain-containing protein [Chloracidobacterium sp.]MBK9436678.1 GWxTD domain-containing protein [Chloracidobacterium sp.]MBK9766298.1 GWxTD domain-containing protein [Chloracidobacterium sp.]
MTRVRFSQSFLLTFVLMSLAAIVAIAQPPDKNKPSQDVTDKARNVKPELKEAYKKWINNDVAYIITKEEKKAFNALVTDEERENFIEQFWRRRDPNPDTEENEYREEYYERIAYSNEKFASGIPGWKTDRGRVYIAWGKPDSVESHPSGGSYDRPSYEGGGSTTTYPFEIWFYRHLDGVGDGLEIEFVDPTGTGEYRMARNANEKDALLMVPGAGMTTAEQLGMSDKGDRISGNDRNAGNNFYREQDSPFRRLEVMTGLMRPPAVKFSDLQSSLTDSPVIDNNPLQFDLRVDFFRQSDDRIITAFTVQTSNRELKFEQIGGLETARMNIFGRITAVSGKRSGIFEDSVVTNATAIELADAMDRKSVYQKAIALTPGTYKVDVVVRDVGTGNKGIVNMGFTVPRYDEKKLSTSSLVLTSKLRSTNERDIGQMFVIGNSKVIPNLGGMYKQGQEVGIYLQVYNAEIDQTTLRPAVDVTYVLTKDGKEVLRQDEDWSGLSDSGQRLTLARLLPTMNMPTGNYNIRVEIKDRVGGQLIKNEEKFTITQ